VGFTVVLVGAAVLARTTESAQDDYIEVIRTRANAGDAEAQFNLALMYGNGQGVPQDYVEAMAWYRGEATRCDCR